MRIAIASLLLIGSFTLMTCSNISDADPSPRETFIKFFEGPYPMSAVSITEIPSGYVILGNVLVTLSDTVYSEAVIVETDKDGNRIGDYHALPGGTGNAIQALVNNGAVDRYLVVGESIFLDPQAEQAANAVISSMRIQEVANDFESILSTKSISDQRPISETHPVKADYFGGAINMTDDGGVIILGTYKEGVVNQQAAPQKQMLFRLDNNLDSAWFKTYDLVGNTYVNSKSVHHSNGYIIWASAIADIQGDFTTSYITIPFVEEQSIFENFSQLGATSLQLFLAADITPANSPAVGYGVIGTYSEQTDGSKGNLFFARVNAVGSIIPGSDRYFDGIGSFGADIADVDKNTSSIIDNGEAITSTSDDGYILAGTMTTNPEKGNGGKDLFLVKVNASGDPVWMKTIGGVGDEVPVSIKEVENGNLLVCGTNTIGDYSTIFLMKMDKNGELNK